MGLVDFAIPIIVNNTYLGAILAVQVKLNEEIEDGKLGSKMHSSIDGKVIKITTKIIIES